jgi:D-psicose/D-tagatose/L-ribulose 3-epimerase
LHNGSAEHTEANMKFGVNTFIWSATFDQSNFDLLPTIKEGGFDGVEVPLLHPKQFQASSIRKAVEAHGLECNACTVLVDGLSLISDSPDIRRRTREHLQDIIKAPAVSGVGIVAGPLYSPVPGVLRRRAQGSRRSIFRTC